jgi:ABC-type sugar transport system ATPase subunit
MATLTLEGLSSARPGPDGPVGPLDLEIPEGEAAILLGGPGSGARTLLRLVAGLDAVGGGAILLDGRAVTREPPGAREVAMAFRDDALYPTMTVRGNLSWGLSNRGEPAPAIAARVAEAAEALGIAAHLDARPGGLTPPLARRVAIARAVVRSPRILLLDGPLAGLAGREADALRADLGRLHRALGLTTLHASEDGAVAMALGQRVVAMRAGRIAQAGTPTVLYARPESVFVARALGSPPMNLLPAEVQGGAVWFGEVGFAHLDRPDATRLEVGVRPEHFGLCAPGESPLRGAVVFVETLGDRAFAHVEVLRGSERFTLVAAADPSVPPEPGQSVGIDMAPGKEHLFDAEGRRIAR